MRLLVAGGCGFVGAAFIRRWIMNPDAQVLNIDCLTYAANPSSLSVVAQNPGYQFLKADICDRNAIRRALTDFRPDAVINFAAETHVDRSIDCADPFLRTNFLGTAELLHASTDYWRTLPEPEKSRFRYLQVSTDEVYGDRDGRAAATTRSAYRPSSPYAASKAAGDHLVLAWVRTYGLPALITHSGNNYGPGQHPEKLVPRFLALAVQGEQLPLYGDGLQQRDWIHVDDHAAGVLAALRFGHPGQEYLFSGGSLVTNLDLVRSLCAELDRRIQPPNGLPSHFALVKHVADRPGHDRRYCMDDRESRTALCWKPSIPLEQGLVQTVDWHVAQGRGRLAATESWPFSNI